MSDKMPITGLDPYELACLSARVPLSGNPAIDKLIAISMRMEIAKCAMEGLLANGAVGEAAVTEAVATADAFLAKFFKSDK